MCGEIFDHSHCVIEAFQPKEDFIDLYAAKCAKVEEWNHKFSFKIDLRLSPSSHSYTTKHAFRCLDIETVTTFATIDTQSTLCLALWNLQLKPSVNVMILFMLEKLTRQQWCCSYHYETHSDFFLLQCASLLYVSSTGLPWKLNWTRGNEMKWNSNSATTTIRRWSVEMRKWERKVFSSFQFHDGFFSFSKHCVIFNSDFMGHNTNDYDDDSRLIEQSVCVSLFSCCCFASLLVVIVVFMFMRLTSSAFLHGIFDYRKNESWTLM